MFSLSLHYNIFYFLIKSWWLNYQLKVMKKLLIVIAVCFTTVALFSFKAKDDANLIMEESVQYSVNVGLSQDFVSFYDQNSMIQGFDLEPPQIAGWVRAGVLYAKAVWRANGKAAFARLMDEMSRAIPPFLAAGQYGLSAEDLEIAEEIGLINRL